MEELSKAREKKTKEMRTTIGKNIKNYREENYLTQEELSRYCRVGRSNLANIETAKSSPSIELLIDLSLGLGVEVEDFFIK